MTQLSYEKVLTGLEQAMQDMECSMRREIEVIRQQEKVENENREVEYRKIANLLDAEIERLTEEGLPKKAQRRQREKEQRRKEQAGITAEVEEGTRRFEEKIKELIEQYKNEMARMKSELERSTDENTSLSEKIKTTSKAQSKLCPIL